MFNVYYCSTNILHIGSGPGVRPLAACATLLPLAARAARRGQRAAARQTATRVAMAWQRPMAGDLG